MVLTDRQRSDLHAGIYEYLKSRPGETFDKVAAALREADPTIDEVLSNSSNKTAGATPLLEKKWTAIPRLQKRVLELERTLAQSAKIHAHRTTGLDEASARRMLPRQPCTHKLAGHAQVVTAVAVHPVFTIVASGSEDGTVKVSRRKHAAAASKSIDKLVYSCLLFSLSFYSSGTTKAVSTCEHSRATPTRSTRSHLLRAERTWHPAAPT